MGVDPKELNDEEFARAFQQLVTGEKVTGKKWRPSWKPSPALSVEQAKRLTQQSLELTLIMQLVGLDRLAGLDPLGVNIRHAGRTFWSRPRDCEVAVMMARNCRRFLHRLGPWKRVDVGSQAQTALLLPKDRRLDRLELRAYPVRPAIMCLRRTEGSRGYAGDPLLTIDVSKLYSLVRGVGNFLGQSLQSRVDWAGANLTEIYQPHDQTVWWQLEESKDAQLIWKGTTSEGEETTRVGIVLG